MAQPSSTYHLEFFASGRHRRFRLRRGPGSGRSSRRDDGRERPCRFQLRRRSAGSCRPVCRARRRQTLPATHPSFRPPCWFSRRASASLYINDLLIAEGDSGTSNATFTVTLLNPPSGQTVSVDYATTDGTATAPADYLATSGTLVFAAGQTSQNVKVAIIGDRINEFSETFFVNLSNPTGARIVNARGTGLIYGVDPYPQLHISSPNVIEGNVGVTNATFNVSLSSPSGKLVSADYYIFGGTATPGVDYLPVSGSLVFQPGQTSIPINVAILGDRAVEPNETFSLALNHIENALSPFVSDGLCTILDDDGFTVDDVTVAEGNTGTSTAILTVRIASPSTNTVAVNYATADGTAHAPSDYAAASGTLTFAPARRARPWPSRSTATH